MKGHFPPFLPVRSRQISQPTINIVPLVDVLLVLLVILLVTAPTLFHAVRAQLPRAQAQARSAPQPVVVLTVTETGLILWNGNVIHRETVTARLAEQRAANGSTPLVAIAVHRAAPFEPVAQLMADLANAGIRDAQFLLDPNGR